MRHFDALDVLLGLAFFQLVFVGFLLLLHVPNLLIQFGGLRLQVFQFFTAELFPRIHLLHDFGQLIAVRMLFLSIRGGSRA